MGWVERWVRQPQHVGLRRAIFQVHLWSGLGVGLYIFAISISGSVLVYRNELLQAFSPEPRIVAASGPLLAKADLEERARRAHPNYELTEIKTGKSPTQAVEVQFRRGERVLQRLFDPYTGEDLGHVLPAGFRFTLWLKDFHDNLLGDTTGRRVNGVGALLAIVLGLTGTIIWWPGVATWRRSLIFVWRTSWNRFIWHLHSALGFWSMAFIVMWGVTGAYLSFPQPFSALVDYLEPLDEANPVDRVGDSVLYWLAYLHFGRFRNRFPGCGDACGSTLKLVWAAIGLIPPAMFVTGAIMWWNRVVVRARKRRDLGDVAATWKASQGVERTLTAPDRVDEEPRTT